MHYCHSCACSHSSVRLTVWLLWQPVLKWQKGWQGEGQRATIGYMADDQDMSCFGFWVYSWTGLYSKKDNVGSLCCMLMFSLFYVLTPNGQGRWPAKVLVSNKIKIRSCKLYRCFVTSWKCIKFKFGEMWKRPSKFSSQKKGLFNYLYSTLAGKPNVEQELLQGKEVFSCWLSSKRINN